MKKCYYCKWHTDKCKNPNSKNKDKFIDDITKCIPMLIKKPLKLKELNIPPYQVYER